MMVEKIVQIKNKSKDFSNLNDSHLSIQLSLDGFSFCIIDKNSNEIIALYNFSFKNNSPTPQKHLENVMELFQIEELLQKKYNSVNVTHVNELSSLVPKPLFDSEQLNGYLKYSSKVYKNDYIVYDPINNHDMMNVYIPFVNVNNFFLEKFGVFEYKHSSTILIENLLNTYKYSERPHMFVNILRNDFQIVAIADNKLLLYNTFSYKTKEDLVYYILFTAEQLKFNPEKFELIFSGSIDKENELYQFAYKYIRNLNLFEMRSKYSFSEGFTEKIKRNNLTLINQY